MHKIITLPFYSAQPCRGLDTHIHHTHMSDTNQVPAILQAFARLRAYLQSHPKTAMSFHMTPPMPKETHIEFDMQPYRRLRRGDAIASDKLNRTSGRPIWAPVPSDAAPTLHLGFIKFAPTIRATGLGRLLCNIFLQSVTRDQTAPQHVVFTECHFPIFFTVDSYYGWMRSKYLPTDTPSQHMYPRFLHTEDTVDKADPAEVAENNKAIYAYVNLVWSTPLEWASARIKTFMVDSSFTTIPDADDSGGDGGGAAMSNRTLFREDGHRTMTGIRQLNTWLASVKAAPTDALVVEIDDSANVFNSKPIRLRMGVTMHWAVSTGGAAAAASFPVDRDTLLQSIIQYCVMLGNDDGGGGANVGIVSLTNDFFIYLQRTMHNRHSNQLAACCIFSYLIDHARVLYRPIVLTNEVATTLSRMFNVASLADLTTAAHGLRAILPQPTPCFVHVDKTHWVWIPTKKAHSSTYDGTVYIPPDTDESEPFFVADLADERPVKRARPTLDCLHCRAKHEAVSEQLAFCSPVCAQLYYDVY